MWYDSGVNAQQPAIVPSSVKHTIPIYPSNKSGGQYATSGLEKRQKSQASSLNSSAVDESTALGHNHASWLRQPRMSGEQNLSGDLT